MFVDFVFCRLITFILLITITFLQAIFYTEFEFEIKNFIQLSGLVY